MRGKSGRVFYNGMDYVWQCSSGVIFARVFFWGHFEMFSDGFGKATLGFDNSTCVGFAIYMNLGV